MGMGMGINRHGGDMLLVLLSRRRSSRKRRSRRRQDDRRSDVFEEFLPHAHPPVLGLFEFRHPIVDTGIQLLQGLFLLQHTILTEFRHARTPQVTTHSFVEIPASGTKRSVRLPEVLAALIEGAEFS